MWLGLCWQLLVRTLGHKVAASGVICALFCCSPACCCAPPSLPRFDTLAGLRPGGTVLVNAKWKSFEEMEKHMHPMTRSRIAQLRPKARLMSLGLGTRGLLPLDEQILTNCCGRLAVCWGWPALPHPSCLNLTALPPPAFALPPCSSTAWTPVPWPRRLAWAVASTWSCSRPSSRCRA